MNNYLIKGGYSVEIISDNSRIFHNKDYVVLIPNRTLYKIRLENLTSTKTSSIIYIDGQKVGEWKIDPFSSIFIERPLNIYRKFYFAKPKVNGLSNEYIKSFTDKNIGSYLNGVIKIFFVPGYREGVKWIYPNFGCGKDTNPTKIFNSINDIDESKYTEVTLNMVVNEKNEHPFISKQLYQFNDRFNKYGPSEDYIVDPSEIPKIRIYEDFFLLNRILKY